MDEGPKSPREEILKHAGDGATDEEICDVLHMTQSELEEWSDLLAEARAGRRIQLRSKQTELALKGNAALLTLLGKNELGQGRTTAANKVEWPEPELDPEVD